MLVVLFVLSISIVCAYFRFFYQRNLIELSKKINSPPYYPLIGNALIFFNENKMKSYDYISTKVGFPCSIWLGWAYNYVTITPSEVKIILTHPKFLEKNYIYKFFAPAFGNSLIQVQADTWKKNRRHVSKSFSQNFLDSFVSTFYQKSNTLLDIIRKHRKNEDINVILNRFAYDTFAEAVLGMGLEIQKSKDVKLVKNIAILQEIILKRLTNPLIHSDFIFYNLPIGKEFQKNLDELQNYVLNIVRHKRKECEKLKDDEIYQAKKKTFVELLLELKSETGESFDDIQIRDELILFISAATESTAFTLCFVFTCMGMYPDLQQKVYEEVMQVVGAERDIDEKIIPQLKYTEMFLKEVMRFFPIVPMIGRKAVANVDLGDKVIPAGASVLVSPFYVQRDAKYWEDPMRFDPERFTVEACRNREPYTYIPFSDGPRNCIGWKYGLMVMKTVMANVVRNFKLTSSYTKIEDIKLISHMLIRSDGDLDVQFIPR